MIVDDTQDISFATGHRLELDGYSLSIEDVVAVARGSGEVDSVLSSESIKRIQASCHLKNKLIQKEIPIYGVTTGFGDSADRQTSSVKAAQLQHNLLRFLGNGTGHPSPLEVVRATILVRANCLAKGNSGVRPELVERILYYLNNDILPLIPERGSCGASGDLVPLSYLGASLVGEGKMMNGGVARDINAVLDEHELAPLELEAKEGLAITNGTSFLSAFAVLAAWDATKLAFVADVCTGMASEALLGNRGHFNSFLYEQKPHPGQIESTKLISALLADSELSRDSEEIFSGENLGEKDFRQLKCKVQDKYSVRCAPHVVGVLRDTLVWVRRWIEIEINSSNDNPLFDAESGRVHSGGNFYGGHIAQAMDSLKVAVANIADLLDRQLELVVDEKFNNGLTPNLIPFFAEDDPEAGLHHGFKSMQLACSAMAAEALKLSNPASVFSRSTESHNQDKVSMGSIAARDARAIVELTQNVTAIHLLALCQALDLRGTEGMSQKTRAVYELVRKRVPFLDRDRYMEEDIKQVLVLLHSEELEEAVLLEQESAAMTS